MSILRRGGTEHRTANLNGLVQILESVGRGGRSTEGSTVTSDSARQLAAVWRCQHVLADIVAGLPIDQYRKANGVREEVDPPAPFVSSPSQFVDSEGWRYQMMLSALDRGNAYAYVTEFDPGMRFAVKAEVLDPLDVTVHRAGALAPPVYRVGQQEVDSKRMLHMVGFGPRPGSVLGMSPIDYAAQTIGIALDSKKYGGDWYAGGGHPTTALVSDQDINKDDAETAKQRFKESTKNDHVVALGKAWKIQPLQVNPGQALFLEAINATAVDICGFYGIPPEMLGYASSGGGSVTYANREQRAIDLLVFTVQWWVGRMERLIGRQTPPSDFVKISIDALLRSDLLTRYQAAEIGIRSGFLAPNDQRRLEDMAPLPDGEATLWPPYATTPAPTTVGGQP